MNNLIFRMTCPDDETLGAHFLDTALRRGFTLVECPITFHQRVGVSKGGNVNNLRGLKVGVRMMFGMVFGWKLVAS